MTESIGELQRIQATVQKFIQEGKYQQANQTIEILYKATENYRALEEKYGALEEKLRQLQEPPLLQGIIIGPSPDDDKSVIIGSGGQRMEVRIAPDAGLAQTDMVAGREAWLNQDRLVVKVREAIEYGEAADIKDILADGRLEVQTRNTESLLVELLAPLAQERLQIGDRVRINPHLALALEKLPTQETKELELEEVPDVTYDDIGGLNQHIEEIREAIEFPYLYNHLFQLYGLKRPKGILLYGPPGCGKTMLAKAIANSLTHEIRRNLEETILTLKLLIELQQEECGTELVAQQYSAWLAGVRNGASPSDEPTPPDRNAFLIRLHSFMETRGVPCDNPADALEQAQRQLAEGSQAYFMSIKGPELLNKYVGETEHSIRKLFLQAKRRASSSTPVVMFFDEIEAMFRRRGSRVSSDVESTVVPQFLSEIDGVEGLNNVIIIGATNRQDLLDPAILRPGRLDVKIKIERPTPDAARSILGKYLQLDLPIHAETVALAGSVEMALETLIERTVSMLYHDDSLVRVSGQPLNGRSEELRCREFMSGAMLENIVSRAKKRALKREITISSRGLCWEDLEYAVQEEFKQNKDQLVSTTLNLPEEGLEIQVTFGETALRAEIDSLLFSPMRPWLQYMQHELAVN